MESYNPMTTQPAGWGSMGMHPAIRAAMMPLTSGASGMMTQPMWSGMNMPWQMETSVPTGAQMPMAGMQMPGMMPGMQMPGMQDPGMQSLVWPGMENPATTVMPDMDGEE